MATTKQKNKKSKIIILERVALSAFIILGIVTYVNSKIRIDNQKIQIQNLENSITQQQMQNTQLKLLDNEEYLDDYIESVARDTLKFVKPNERVYYNVAGN